MVKHLMMAGLLTVAVWALFIFYWRVNVHMPSTSDVVISLIVMPAILLLSVFLVRKAAIALVSPKDSTVASGTSAAATNSQNNPPSSQQERDWFLPILAGNVITMHGNTVHDLAETLSAKTAKFDLDSVLVDSNGYPILSGRIKDLDETEWFSQFEEWEASESGAGHTWLQEDKRAIALASMVFTGLVDELLSHPALSEFVGNAQQLQQGQECPVIYLLSLWPDHWAESQKQSAARWLQHLLENQGWPLKKISSNPVNLTGVIHPMHLVDQLNMQVHRQNIPGLHILIASQSFLGEQTISDWENAGLLHTSSHMQGRIPGEGAAGLVVSDPELSTKLATYPLVKLHRVAQRKREKSADDPGKIKPDTLIETMGDALAVSKENPDEIGKISADTDTRARRVGELLEAMNEVFPDMDADTDCYRLEANCGFAGISSSWSALLLGWQQAVEHEKPVLCVFNNDSFERSAVVLSIEPGALQNEMPK